MNHQLPAELLLMTFEYLAPDMLNGSFCRPDELMVFYNTLCSSARVCRAWRSPAQELLFRHVAPRAGRANVHSEPTVRRRLLRAKRSDATKQAEDDRRYAELAGLRARTTSVSLRLGKYVDDDEPHTREIAQHLSWDQFVGMVQAFPNLQTLVVHSHVLDIFNPNPTEKQCRLLRAHRNLKNIAIYAHAQLPQWLPILLNAWSSTLESVEIAVPRSRTMGDLDLDAVGVGIPCPLPNLRRFSCVVSLAGCSTWLQTTFRISNLTHLRCKANDVFRFIPIVKTTLVDLTVDPADDTMSGFLDPFPALGDCTALLAARFGRTVVLDQLRTLPDGVEEVWAAASPTCLRRFVNERPAIKRITLLTGFHHLLLWLQSEAFSDDDDEIGMGRLRAECLRRRIELELLVRPTYVHVYRS